jgi:hypothetical protein
MRNLGKSTVTRDDLVGFNTMLVRLRQVPKNRSAALHAAGKWFFGGSTRKAAQLFARLGLPIVGGHPLFALPADQGFYDSWRTDSESLKEAFADRPLWHASHFAAEWQVSPWLVEEVVYGLGVKLTKKSHTLEDLPAWLPMSAESVADYVKAGWLSEEIAAYHRMTMVDFCAAVRQYGIARRVPITPAFRQPVDKNKTSVGRHRQWRAGILEAGSIAKYARREGIPYQVAYYRAGVCKISQHVVVK